MISVAVVGPESTGKTTLTKALSVHYKTVWIPEFAREYLTNLGRPYDQSDLLKIASGQLKSCDNGAKRASRLLLQDTDLMVIKIWSEVKYGTVNPWIKMQMELNPPDYYFLTFYDIPYEEDPLRESSESRPQLFDLYEKEVKKIGIPYTILQGSLTERLTKAISTLNTIL